MLNNFSPGTGTTSAAVLPSRDLNKNVQYLNTIEVPNLEDFAEVSLDPHDFWLSSGLLPVFRTASLLRASDLFLDASYPPIVKVDGVLRQLEGLPKIPKDCLRSLICHELLNKEQIVFLESKGHLSIDFSYELPHDEGYFRVNVAFADRGPTLAARLIPSRVPTLAELGLPIVVEQLTLKTKRGLILITGPTGSGKSTTLAAMIQALNQNPRGDTGRIITLEEPIEYRHQSKQYRVIQREIGRDCPSFERGLRDALRQSPDVILVGEMRDRETIALAITAAETGHLVLGTLHTRNAVSSIDRIVDSFSGAEKDQVRSQLSQSLVAVISQQLLPRRDETKRIVAVEVMINNSAIANLIREGKSHQIENIIQTHYQHGMVLMDKYLLELVNQGLVSVDDARKYAINSRNFESMLGQAVGLPKTRGTST